MTKIDKEDKKDENGTVIETYNYDTEIPINDFCNIGNRILCLG